MNGNLQVGNLFGIPFYVNISWFLVLVLFTWNYGTDLASIFPSLPGTLPWLLGLLTALLLFSSVLAHELGHSFAAIQQGIGVNSITLFLFGGLASLEKESDTPAGAFQVAIAGPAVSLMLFALLFSMTRLLPISGPLATIVGLLAYINLALGLFNLLPGLPLDGGNVVKSLVWKITGDPYQGVKFASYAGQAIGWLAVGIGFAGVAGISSFGSVWTLLIGWFLLRNANRSAQSATIQQRLDGLTAKDALTTNSPVVQAGTTLRRFADDVLLSGPNHWRKFLVVNEAETLVGSLLVEDLQTIPRDRWETTVVSDVMTNPEALTLVTANQPLLDVVKLMQEKQVPVLGVTHEGGKLLGLLERQAVLELLRQQSSAAAA